MRNILDHPPPWRQRPCPGRTRLLPSQLRHKSSRRRQTLPASPDILLRAPSSGTGELPFRVTDACIAHCTFCADHVPRRTPDLATAEVLDRLRLLLDRVVPTRLLLTGGEPTLHPRLAQVIALARQRGVQQVVLQTHGAPLADAAKLRAWQEAGLTGARVLLVAAEEGAAYGLTQLAQGWHWQQRGIEQALTAGLDVAVETPVTRGTVSQLTEIARYLSSLATARGMAGRPGLGPWQLVPYRSRPPGAPDDQHVAPRGIEPVLLQAVELARQGGVEVALPPNEGWHPCAFSAVNKLRDLLVRAPGGVQRSWPQACAGCAVRPSCPGVEQSLLDVLGPAVVEPIADARRAAWLPLHRGGSGRTALGRERNVQVPVAKDEGQGREVHELVLRVIHACNQRCAFCWVDFEAPAMDLSAVAERLDAAFADGQRPSVAFTGGEPLLHADIAAMIALAAQRGAAAVSLQTNATRLLGLRHAQTLREAGLTHALVSLHGADAAESDALTAAPGTFARTVQGIRWLCESGVKVTINHVLTRDLGPKFPQFIDFIGGELAHPLLALTIAVAGHIDAGPIEAQVLPTHTSLGPAVAEGLAKARRLGLQIVGFLHPCGIVPCALPDPWVALEGVTLRPPALDDEATLRDGGVKAPLCQECALNRVCFGVRREYAAVHGLGELKPVPPRPAGSGRV